MGFKSVFKSIGHDLAHVGLMTIAVGAAAGYLAPPPFNAIIVAGTTGAQYLISRHNRNKVNSNIANPVMSGQQK